VPSINGQDFQHGQITASVDTGASVPFTLNSFSALSHKVTAKKNPVRDSQGNIRGFTIGMKETEGQLSLLQSEWVLTRRLILQALPTLPSGLQAGILTVQFNLNITYGNSLSNLFSDQLLGVMFDADAFDSKDDQNAITKDVPLFITDMILDGKSPIYYRPY
jgi:hypothetical protein